MKVKLHSLRHLSRIGAYIREYDCRGRFLCHAASDVLDGAVYRSEIDELIRKRLIRVIHDGAGLPDDPLCGGEWTVHLTERAIKLFWPKRRHP